MKIKIIIYLIVLVIVWIYAYWKNETISDVEKLVKWTNLIYTWFWLDIPCKDLNSFQTINYWNNVLDNNLPEIDCQRDWWVYLLYYLSWNSVYIGDNKLDLEISTCTVLDCWLIRDNKNAYYYDKVIDKFQWSQAIYKGHWLFEQWDYVYYLTWDKLPTNWQQVKFDGFQLQIWDVEYICSDNYWCEINE